MLAIASNLKRMFHEFYSTRGVGMNVTLKRVLCPTVAPTLHKLLEQCHVALKLSMYMCMVCMALMTTMVLRAKPYDSYVSVIACGARRVLLSILIH